VSEDKLQSGKSTGASHSDPDPDEAAPTRNHGSFKVFDISGRPRGSNTRILCSNAVNLDVSPNSESDRILSSSKVSRPLSGNDSPVGCGSCAGLIRRT
jgi:hypothetical protein